MGWCGGGVLRRWGATAITDDLGWLRHHPWNRRKVSISSSERILQSVGRSSDEGGNDDTGPKFRWRAEAPAVEERTKGDVGWRGRCWSAWEWMRGHEAEDRHTGARGSSSMDEAAPREKKREGSVHDTRGMKERGTWWRGCDAWRRGGGSGWPTEARSQWRWAAAVPFYRAWWVGSTTVGQLFCVGPMNKILCEIFKNIQTRLN
jgi:hypothetical protein